MGPRDGPQDRFAESYHLYVAATSKDRIMDIMLNRVPATATIGRQHLWNLLRSILSIKDVLSPGTMTEDACWGRYKPG
jgi:hypothetical protein